MTNLSSFLCASVFLAACGSSQRRTELPAELIVHSIRPSETTTGIQGADAPHLAGFDASRPPSGLYLHLPGTAGSPDGARAILLSAARAGLHAVGLSYPNEATVAGLCRGSDEACFEQVRLEILDGVDRTPLVQVDRANCIENRLARLLEHLQRQFPAEGWGGYLENDRPRWRDIRVGGHSQGGGHAAMIAREHEVARVALFSAVVDNREGVPVAWVRAPHATPSDRWFGLVHAREEAFGVIVANWRALGLDGLGEPAFVERDGPAGSHMLVTEATPAGGGSAFHGSTVTDPDTPRLADGSPALAPTWDVMLGR